MHLVKGLVRFFICILCSRQGYQRLYGFFVLQDPKLLSPRNMRHTWQIMQSSAMVRSAIEPSTVVQGLVFVKMNVCHFNISHREYTHNLSPLFRKSVILAHHCAKLDPCIANSTCASHSDCLRICQFPLLLTH